MLHQRASRFSSRRRPIEKTGQYVPGDTFAEGLVYFHGAMVSLLRVRRLSGGGGDCASEVAAGNAGRTPTVLRRYNSVVKLPPRPAGRKDEGKKI